MKDYWNDDSEKIFEEYINNPLKNPFPNCRCHIITMLEEIYFTYATKYLIDEYLEEYNKQDLWTN